MRRIRDASIIGDAGIFQKRKAIELEQAFIKLNNDINALRENYQGAGAEANINAFLRGSDNFKKVIAKIKSYGEYQEIVFNHDVENIDNATKEITSLLSNPIMTKQLAMLNATLPEEIGTIPLESEGDTNA